MKNKLKKEQEELDISISVEELINRLKKLPKGSRVAIAQTGYYGEVILIVSKGYKNLLKDTK